MQPVDCSKCNIIISPGGVEYQLLDEGGEEADKYSAEFELLLDHVDTINDIMQQILEKVEKAEEARE